ncbi:hypothetical protein UlMin_022409 [Ulmus minor]
MKMENNAILFLSSFLLTWVLSIKGEQVLDMSPCNFPAIYNFGDSNSDTGGVSAAFYPMASPCGETFFHGPSGRACDGRLTIDFTAQHLGLPYLSAYLDSIGTNFSHGANFATGGSTIRRQNESIFVNGISPFSLDIQFVQFSQFKARTAGLFYNQANRESNERTIPKPEEFSNALYILDIGQNDISAGFRPMSYDKFQAEIPDIINQLATVVQNLYNQGARAFWIHNTGPIGCLPVTLHYIHNQIPGYVDEIGCVKAQNDMAKEFNKQLKQKVTQLRTELPLAALTYVDMYAAKYELISNAKKQGFLEKESICCGYHEDNVHIWCGNKAEVDGTEIYAGSCEDPSLYISWDGVHYTEAANRWIADHILSGSFSDPQVSITQACHAHLYL